MKKFAILVFTMLAVFGISCSNASKKSNDTLVLIQTDFGNIKLKLYDETPEHKNNFLKLINEGYYNGLLFHRVMQNFMIQGGDPNSKNAAPGTRLGAGNPGYTIPAEINPKYFHKKGSLAAARLGGPANPEKRSSGSQFYLVHGEIFTPGKLDTMEMVMNQRAKSQFSREQLQASGERLNEFRKNNDEAGFNVCVAEIRAEADTLWATHKKITFSPEQREAYTTIGGYPSLDGEYTVFGEVVEGLDVLDKIAAVETDQNNRPTTDIKMEIEVLK
ncbi:MAG: peptidylprolyl isomerase [Draconibacterium sp.]